LYFADLVLADMTIPNGNVYYEIGIRHAARDYGCVMLAADWSRQLFDVAQMRTVRYPLPEGAVTTQTADEIRKVIKQAIPALAKGISPMHESIKGYPGQVDETAASVMKDRLALQAAFQAQVRAVRAAPREQRMDRARALADTYSQASMTGPIAIALLLMLRDCVTSQDGWRIVLDFIDRLPDDLKALAEVAEQHALALSNAGRTIEAIAALEALVATSGPTPERLGLLGGRQKRLMKDAPTPGDREQALSRAIDHYERGMELDLNEYYCSSNLPTLYRLRNRRGDEERAQSVLMLIIAACQRARKRGAIDPWLRPTLLVSAFDARDVVKAEELADEVADEGPARWQLATILGSLEASLEQVGDPDCASGLRQTLERLRRLA
jgi:hypothetical protein